MFRTILAETRAGNLLEIRELEIALDCLFKKGSKEATWHLQGQYQIEDMEGISFFYDTNQIPRPKRGYRYCIQELGLFRNLEHIQDYFRILEHDPIISMTDGDRILGINPIVEAVEKHRKLA